MEGSGLWSRVVGAEPESVDNRPRENVTAESGPVQDNILRVITRPGRVDWTLRPGAVAGRVQRLSNVPDSVRVLHQGLANTLEIATHIERLAFGVTLLNEVDSHRDGVQSLAHHLGQLSLSGGIRDFAYRVNRRRRLTAAPSVDVNRLATWSVEEMISVDIAIPQGRVNVRAPDVVRKLVLDINTVPSGTRTSDKVGGWFNELVEMAREIATGGDIE